MFYCCDRTPWPKTTSEGKGWLGLHISIIAHHWRKSGQWLKQGQRELWRNVAYWLFLLSCYSSAFLHSLELPFLWWHCPQWSDPSHISRHWRQCPRDMATDQSNWGNSAEVPVLRALQWLSTWEKLMLTPLMITTHLRHSHPIFINLNF